MPSGQRQQLQHGCQMNRTAAACTAGLPCKPLSSCNSVCAGSLFWFYGVMLARLVGKPPTFHFWVSACSRYTVTTHSQWNGRKSQQHNSPAVHPQRVVEVAWLFRQCPSLCCQEGHILPNEQIWSISPQERTTLPDAARPPLLLLVQGGQLSLVLPPQLLL